MNMKPERLRSVAEAARGAGMDAVVVAPSPDLVYLTGYDPMPLERPSLLIVREDRAPVLLVPELERRLAAEAIGDGIELHGWTDAHDPYAVAAGLLPAEGRIGVGDRIWGVHVLALQGALPAARFTSAAPVLGALRAKKDDDELAALRRAARGADETFRAICTGRFLGRREEEVAADLADLLVRNGHSRAAFTIVGSGPNSASPHHEPSGRTILPRDVVVLDFRDGFADDAREPPIEDVDVAEIAEHDVRGLEIAMDDAARVRELDREADICERAQQALAICDRARHQVGERHAGEALHREERAAALVGA